MCGLPNKDLERVGVARQCACGATLYSIWWCWSGFSVQVIPCADLRYLAHVWLSWVVVGFAVLVVSGSNVSHVLGISAAYVLLPTVPAPRCTCRQQPYYCESGEDHLFMSRTSLLMVHSVFKVVVTVPLHDFHLPHCQPAFVIDGQRNHE